MFSEALFTIILLLLFNQTHCVDEWKNKNIDFIIVGAGAAGSAIASRLSENEDYQVLLLEAGGEPTTFNDVPYFSPGPFGGKLDWDFKTEPQEHACWAFKDKKWIWPRGKGLGGSTLINTMIYNRGDPKDYDNWRDLGNEGWSYRDVLPFFQKIEDYRAPFINEDDAKYHGTEGPITISRAPFESELTKIILDAGEELGYSEVDYNSASQRGFARTVFTLRKGLRLSSFKAYLGKARSRSNLHIVTDVLVSKVEFNDEKRATGVVFEGTSTGKLWVVKANKEIILSAGATNSPQILLLSGIGPRLTLEKFGIPVVSDLSGVGQNLQDHVYVISTVATLNKEIGFRYRSDVTAENFEKLETSGRGPLSVPYRSIAMAFVDSEYNNETNNWPDLEFLIYQDVVSFDFQPDYDLKAEQTPGKSKIAMFTILLRPKSVGNITIRSTNPRDPAIFQPNYLSDKNDVKRLISGVKLFKKLIKTKALENLGAHWDHTSHTKGCEKYQFMSDDYLECHIRHYSIGGFHQSSTCKMGRMDDKSAVVDSQLRVFGVSNLRVADNSISPKIVSAHTMAPSIMIGEKAADIIHQYWNQKKKEEL